MGAVRQWCTTAGRCLATAVRPSRGLSAARPTARPTSPHLTIYQPQLTWLLSIAHRVTGAFLGGGLHVFGICYALGRPSRGLVDRIEARAARTGPGVQAGARAVLAGPFFFHMLNGVRHLVWDVGLGLGMRGVYAGGYAVCGLSALGALWAAYPGRP